MIWYYGDTDEHRYQGYYKGVKWEVKIICSTSSLFAVILHILNIQIYENYKTIDWKWDKI